MLRNEAAADVLAAPRATAAAFPSTVFASSVLR
jgi:hypothetical protein